MLSMMSRGAAPPAPLTRPPLPQQRPHRQSGGATATLPLVNPLAAAPVGRQDRRAEVDETAAGTDEAVTASALFEDPDPEETGSWDLVRAAQAGDMTAFGELFDRYYDIVFRYVLFRMGDRSLAEDVTQETFVRALRRISSVSYQGRDIGAWFVTIARNLIFDHVKSSRYRLEQTTSEIMRAQAQRRPAGMHPVAVPAGHVGRRDRPGHGSQRGRGEGSAAPRHPPARAAAAGRPAVTREAGLRHTPDQARAANEHHEAANGPQPVTRPDRGRCRGDVTVAPRGHARCDGNATGGAASAAATQ